MTKLSTLGTWLLVGLVCLCTPLTAQAKASTADIVDRIVAVVNGDPITLSELKKKAEPLINQYQKDNPGAPLPAEARQEVLARILPQVIDEKLVENQIDKMGIKVSDAELEDAIKRICEQNNMTREAFIARLGVDGITFDEYKKELKLQIEKSHVINAQVRSKIVVTDEQIDAYLKEHPAGSTTKGPFFVLQQIAIMPKDPSDPAEVQKARQRAEEALAEIKGGKPFEEVAARYSDLPSGQNGGYLGALTAKEMAPFMQKAIEGLDPGQVTAVVDTPTGPQIFRLKEIQKEGEGGGIQSAQRDEIRDRLYREQINERFDQWLKDLRAKSTIRILL